MHSIYKYFFLHQCHAPPGTLSSVIGGSYSYLSTEREKEGYLMAVGGVGYSLG